MDSLEGGRVSAVYCACQSHGPTRTNGIQFVPSVGLHETAFAE